jgi:protoheme IX farnesyltransferase
LKQESDGTVPPEHSIPLDASAQLSNFSSALPTTSLRRKLAAYLALTKPRLSFLIVLTTTSAYGMYPISSLLTLDPAMTPLPTLSTSTLTFIYLTVGTFLSCCSANTLNMMFEPKFDALMSRTRNRPLVRGFISRRGALFFAIGTAVTGLSLLYIGTNPTTTTLSAANIFLYAFVYTPLKRISVVNTWVGAVVGGIPPLMGWVAAAAQNATIGHDNWRDMLFSESSIGGWLLGGILFAWQFPHFNALSHLIRDEYKAAGYRMMAWVNPARNARVALRYSILMFPISIGLWYVNVVGHGFLVGSTFANGWLVREAYRFWQHQGANGTARGLFWASIWQLPILLVGGLVTKKGLWDGVWRNIFGQPDEEDEDYLYYDEEEEHEGEKSKLKDSASSRPSSPRTSTLSTA